MEFRDAKVGDVIEIYVIMGPKGISVNYDENGSDATITATVMSPYDPSVGGTVLIWKASQTHPNNTDGHIGIVIADNWLDQGFSCAGAYNQHCKCKYAGGIPAAKKKYEQECPCGIHPSMCEYHKS